MIQTILLVIAVFLLVVFINRLITKHELFVEASKTSEVTVNYLLEIIVITITISYIIWYCN